MNIVWSAAFPVYYADVQAFHRVHGSAEEWFVSGGAWPEASAQCQEVQQSTRPAFYLPNGDSDATKAERSFVVPFSGYRDTHTVALAVALIAGKGQSSNRPLPVTVHIVDVTQGDQ